MPDKELNELRWTKDASVPKKKSRKVAATMMSITVKNIAQKSAKILMKMVFRNSIDNSS
jgi:hypothetical protein